MSSGCATPERQMLAHGQHPVLLIGIDGLEWSVVLPMLRDGRLPTLAGLIKNGAFGKLATLRPTVSPAIWTTIATGMLPDTHGISGFVLPEPRRGGPPRIVTSRDRRTKALWNILADYGRRAHIVGWWATFPAEPINGVMVAQVTIATPRDVQAGKRIWKGRLVDGLTGQVYPPAREAEMLALMADVDAALPAVSARFFPNLAPPLPRGPARLWQHCRWALAADELYYRISMKLLSEDRDFSLLAVYFGGPDVVAHRFWRFMRPEPYTYPPSSAEIDRFGDVIPAYYAYVDDRIGHLLSSAPRDTVTLIVSDHGMGPTNLSTPFAADLPIRALNSAGHESAPAGVFVAHGPSIRAHAFTSPLADDFNPSDIPHVGSVLDVTPTVLALLGLPIGRGMHGTAMGTIVELAGLPPRVTHTKPAWRPEVTGRIHTEAQTIERLEQLRALGYLQDAPKR